jgi:hypothetical protein
MRVTPLPECRCKHASGGYRMVQCRRAALVQRPPVPGAKVDQMGRSPPPPDGSMSINNCYCSPGIWTRAQPSDIDSPRGGNR